MNTIITLSPTELTYPQISVGSVTVRAITVIPVIENHVDLPSVSHTFTYHKFGEPRSLQLWTLARSLELRGPPAPQVFRLPVAACPVCPPRLVRTTDSPNLSPRIRYPIHVGVELRHGT